MSNDAPPPIPRRKTNVIWYFAAAFVLFVAWFSWQLFGQNPPITIAKNTTYITQPLDENGLPEFRRYVRERYREGVTPENNAAVLLWQAAGPGELDSRNNAAICREIGVNPVAPTAAARSDHSFRPLNDETLYESVHQWVATQTQGNGDETVCDAVLEIPLQQPWTSAQFPPLAAWLRTNESALKLTVEATGRPRYYSPSLALAGASDEPLAVASFPGLERARELARGLMARAMWHLGEGRSQAAWQDLSALRRLSQLIGQGPSLIEQIVAVHISDLACTGTIALLHHGKLSNDELQIIRRALNGIPPFAYATSTIDQYERLAYLEIVTRMASRDTQRLQSQLGLGPGVGSSIPDRFSIDWNLALESGNDYFDRFAAVSRSPLLVERAQGLAEIEDELATRTSYRDRSSHLLLALFSRRIRNRIAADWALGVFMQAMPVALHIQDRANLHLDLARTAAALAEYRAQKKTYPEILSDLAVGSPDESYIDPFSDNPYIYHRDDAGGYLLYSVFHNRIDDGGTDGHKPIVKGEWVDERQPVEYYNESDYVVRIPRPPFKLPTPPANP